MLEDFCTNILKRRQRIWSPKSTEKILSFRQELNSQLAHSNCLATVTLLGKQGQIHSCPISDTLILVTCFCHVVCEEVFSNIIHNRLGGSIELFPMINCEISADSQHQCLFPFTIFLFNHVVVHVTNDMVQIIYKLWQLIVNDYLIIADLNWQW